MQETLEVGDSHLGLEKKKKKPKKEKKKQTKDFSSCNRRMPFRSKYVVVACRPRVNYSYPRVRYMFWYDGYAQPTLVRVLQRINGRYRPHERSRMFKVQANAPATTLYSSHARETGNEQIGTSRAVNSTILLEKVDSTASRCVFKSERVYTWHFDRYFT